MSSEHQMRYGLQWGAHPAPIPPELLRVLGSAMGGRPEGELVMVIDFEDGSALPEDLGTVDVTLRSNSGTTTPGILQRNPETNGPRLAFTFMPEGAEVAEFHMQLRTGEAPLSEVWLYR